MNSERKDICNFAIGTSHRYVCPVCWVQGCGSGGWKSSDPDSVFSKGCFFAQDFYTKIQNPLKVQNKVIIIQVFLFVKEKYEDELKGAILHGKAEELINKKKWGFFTNPLHEIIQDPVFLDGQNRIRVICTRIRNPACNKRGEGENSYFRINN